MNQDSPHDNELIKPAGLFGWNMDRQQIIKTFLGFCATITIAALFLIMWSLLREGMGFFSTYRWELSVYRQAGLEYVDYLQKPLSDHDVILSKLNRALNAEQNTIAGFSRERRNAAYLAKTNVESRIKAPREALQEALKRQSEDSSISTESLQQLRQELSKATVEAAFSEPLSIDLFTIQEQLELRRQLSRIQPDDRDPPPFITQLAREASLKDREAKERYRELFHLITSFEDTTNELSRLANQLREIAVSTKSAATLQHMSEAAKTRLLKAANETGDPQQRARFLDEANSTDTTPIQFEERIQPILARQGEVESLIPPLMEKLAQVEQQLILSTTSEDAGQLIKEARLDIQKLIHGWEKSRQLIREWNWNKPVPFVQAITAFLFGGDWITNSSWQDFYGVLPLLSGSLLISCIALMIAVPVSVAAAIYVNQFATSREQEVIKPIIEFIQAIPSVVLGFIGISVLGDLIKSSSEIAWLQWIPGFPIQERLNMFNAGCLLALMAIPTIFSLAEDAINNVPRAFSEASEALGSTKLQTVFRVILPASMSGIFAAVLLGLGRILGETMVVLLVAGNRIAIPDFSDSIGVIFQPAHTLTGIIAQELGEVSQGSTHWQALFMVGTLLFFISLAINWVSRMIVRKFQCPKI